MSDINEVRERLENRMQRGIPFAVAADIRALLADHARLNELLGNSEQLQPAPAADPEDVRIVRIIAEKIDEGRLDHPGFYKNGRLSAALRNLLTLIDGQAKCCGELSLIDAINDYLEAQDALDNWETAGPNRDRYESVMARRNAARRDLESAMQPTKGEGE